MKQKRCPSCTKTMPASEFYSNKRSRSGLSSYCKRCTIEKAKMRHRETYIPKERESPEVKTCSRCGFECEWESRSEYFPKLRKSKDGSYVYASFCRSCKSEQQKQWRKETGYKLPAEINRRGCRRRNYRERAIRELHGQHTDEEWGELCAKYDHRCACCGSDAPLTRDHVIPLSKGGTDLIDNIQPLCQSCNASKGVGETDYR